MSLQWGRKSPDRNVMDATAGTHVKCSLGQGGGIQVNSKVIPPTHAHTTQHGKSKGSCHNFDDIFKSKPLKNCTSIKKLQTLINYITDTETLHKVLVK